MGDGVWRAIWPVLVVDVVIALGLLLLLFSVGAQFQGVGFTVGAVVSIASWPWLWRRLDRFAR